MIIEPKVSKYIDTAIERERKIFSKETKALFDELSKDRQTKEEVRIIAREEIYEGLKPVNAKLDYLNDERGQMMEALIDIKA